MNNALESAPTSGVANEPPVDPSQVGMLIGGTEFYGIASIARIYAQAWPEMTTLCLGDGPQYDWLRSIEAKVELIDSPGPFVLSSYLSAIAQLPGQWKAARRTADQINERLSGSGIRIIHTHRLRQQLIAGHLRKHGYKSVWQINNNTNRRRAFDAGKRLNKMLAGWGADLILPASDFIKRNWDGGNTPIKTIRNAASVLRETPPEPAPPPPLRCLVAGRLEDSKGHHVAVEAVLAARRRGCDVTLDIFGGPSEDNPYADRLSGVIRDAGEEQSIRFRGFCENLRELHADFHLGLQCRTDPEPCSLWVCETLVDGLPLVASATGGTPELVADGETGILVPPSDPEALADAIVSLAEAPERLLAMCQAAFERGRDHFTIQRMLGETLAAYQTVV